MEELEKYYNYLKSNGADVPPNYNSFKSTLSDSNNAKQYYSYLQKNKFDVAPTYDSFSKTFGLGQPAPKPLPSLQEQGSLFAPAGTYQPSPEEVGGQGAGNVDMNKKFTGVKMTPHGREVERVYESESDYNPIQVKVERPDIKKSYQKGYEWSKSTNEHSIVNVPQANSEISSDVINETHPSVQKEKLYQALPTMRKKAVKAITENNLIKKLKVAPEGSPDYNAEKLNVEQNLKDEDWMPSHFLNKENKAEIDKKAIEDFSFANKEKPEAVQAKVDKGDYVIEDGKVKEKGGFVANLGQGAKDFVNNIGLALNVEAAKANKNTDAEAENEIKYHLNQFQKAKRFDREVAATDLKGKAGKMAGGLVPYVAASALTGGYGDIPLMGLSNMGESHSEVWNDPHLTEDEKVKAINRMSKDDFMIGAAQGAAFHMAGEGAGKVTANSLLSKYAPTADLKYKFTQNLYNNFNSLLHDLPKGTAKTAGIFAGTEGLNEVNKAGQGVQVDFSKVPQAALEGAMFHLIMAAPKVVTSAMGTLRNAVKSGEDKAYPEWFNNYSKETQDALNNIVKAPEPLYQQMVSQLDASQSKGVAATKKKIETFRGYYNALPEGMPDEAKDKALHILQLKTEAVHDGDNTKAQAYDGLLQKVVNGGNVDEKKEPLLIDRFQTPSITVTRPEEMNKPEAVTIAPKENEPEAQSKGAAVVLPQNNKPIETVHIEGKEYDVPQEKSGVSVVLPEGNKSPNVVDLNKEVVNSGKDIANTEDNPVIAETKKTTMNTPTTSQSEVPIDITEYEINKGAYDAYKKSTADQKKQSVTELQRRLDSGERINPSENDDLNDAYERAAKKFISLVGDDKSMKAYLDKGAERRKSYFDKALEEAKTNLANSQIDFLNKVRENEEPTPQETKATTEEEQPKEKGRAEAVGDSVPKPTIAKEEGGVSQTPLKDEYKRRVDNIDDKTKYTDAKQLKEGDYVAIKHENGNMYTGFVKKIGNKNIKIESPYGGGGDNDYKQIQELQFPKSQVEAFYKPKSESSEPNNRTTTSSTDKVVPKEEVKSEVSGNEKPVSENVGEAGRENATAPAAVVEKKPTTKVSKGLRAAAQKLREGELPSFLKANLPDGTEQAGFGGKELQEAVAKGLEAVADLIDSGAELAKAIDEGFKHIQAHYSDNKAKFKDEAAVKKQFADFVNENLGDEGVPPTVTEKPEGSGSDNWTAIRKEKQQEIEAVRLKYEKQKVKGWSETLQNGLEKVQRSAPSKSLYDASLDLMYRLKAGDHIGDLTTDEALAVMQNLKRDIGAKRAKIAEAVSSDSSFDRMAALVQDEGLENDYTNTALAIKDITTTAGRTLNYAQSELAFDPEHGLQLRRMSLMRAKGGEKLSPEEMKWTQEMWDKEKDIARREQEVRDNEMNAAFEKQIADLKNDYEKKLKQASNKPATSKEKTLSQKGKDVADLIRKLKTDKGSLKIDFTLGGWDLAVEGVAQLVEKGAQIGEAIDQLIKDKKIAFKTDTDKSSFENNLVHFLENIGNRDSSLEGIKEMAEESGAKDLTNEMVAKGYVRDFVNSHLGEFEAKDILDEATKKLKEVLPEVNKKTLIEAFLKEGEFKQPTKVDLEGSLAAAKKELVGIAKLTEDISDLEGLKGFRERGSGNEREKSEHEKELLAKKEAIIKEQSDRKAKFAKEYRELETERNRQLKRVAELTEKRDKLKAGIREKKSVTPKVDTPEIEELKHQVKEADTELRKAEAEAKRIDKEKQDRKDKIDELNANIERAKRGMEHIKTFKNKSPKVIDDELEAKRRELKKVTRENLSDDKLQEKKLEAVKQKLRNDIKELTRKLTEHDYDEVKPVYLKKLDAEAIKLQAQKRTIEEQYNAIKRRLHENDKGVVERTTDFVRGILVNWLIMGSKTFAKISYMSVIRPMSEATTKLTTGKLFDAFFPNISKAAMRGGESSSIRSVASGFGAYFRQMKQTSVEAKYEKSNKAAEAAEKEYKDYKESGGTDKNKLQQLEANMKNKAMSAMGDFVYQFIGGSSIQDAAKALIHRANIIEGKFGHVDQESFKDGNWLDKTSYVISFIGRSHSALKTFSGRFSFAASFMARIEAAVRDGEALTSDKMLEIAHESYFDFERGKYQQSNFISDKWNQFIGSSDRKMSNGKWDKYNTWVKALVRFNVPITRVPINVLHEAVVEYTAGAFKSVYMSKKSYLEATKQAFDEGFSKADEDALKDRVRQIVSNMDEKQAATIARCFRKGTMGLGLYALATFSGLVHFGVFPHLGQPKKKDEDKLGKDELNPGQIQFGDTKLGELPSAMIEHTPALWPMFMGLGMAKIYKDDIDKGSIPAKAIGDAVYTHFKILEGGIPQLKLFGVSGKINEYVQNGKKRMDDWGIFADGKTGIDWDNKEGQAFLEKNKLKVPKLNQATLRVEKDEKHPDGKLKNQEFGAVKQKRDEKMKEALDKAMKDGLISETKTPAQNKAEIQWLSEQSLKYAKEQVFGKKQKSIDEQIDESINKMDRSIFKLGLFD